MQRIPQTEIPQPTRHPGRLRALAASARLANVPSVASNVCVGAVIAASSGADASMISAKLPFVIASGICLYLGGNFLNDWADREWDRTNRPERALPRGLFQPELYLSTAAALAVLGMGLAAEANTKSLPAAGAIMTFVLIYTVFHKRSAWSVIPMGLCRALLPALGFLGCMDIAATPESAILALFLLAGMALFCYIVGLSLNARCASSRSWVPVVLFTLAGIISAAPTYWIFAILRALGVGASTFYIAQIAPLGVYVTWMLLCHRRFRKTVSSHVSSLLAGIPLVDWIFILPLGMAMDTATGHALIWVPPVAFLAALALQRLAPAT